MPNFPLLQDQSSVKVSGKTWYIYNVFSPQQVYELKYFLATFDVFEEYFFISWLVGFIWIVFIMIKNRHAYFIFFVCFSWKISHLDLLNHIFHPISVCTVFENVLVFEFISLDNSYHLILIIYCRPLIHSVPIKYYHTMKHQIYWLEITLWFHIKIHQ